MKTYTTDEMQFYYYYHFNRLNLLLVTNNTEIRKHEVYKMCQ